jgi:hypothetical protein
MLGNDVFQLLINLHLHIYVVVPQSTCPAITGTVSGGKRGIQYKLQLVDFSIFILGSNRKAIKIHIFNHISASGFQNCK